MPGRLLGLVTNRVDNVKQRNHSPPSGFLPPYSSSSSSSLAPPPNNPTKSQESLVMDVFNLKRHSLGGRHHSDKKTSKAQESQKKNTLGVDIESPPIVFFNNPQTSSGALLSGQLKLNVGDPNITLEKLEMHLMGVVSTKKPVASHCDDCAQQKTELYHWSFLKAPGSFRTGMHKFPFSYLLPGHLPATTLGSMATLTYYLSAVATMSNNEKLTYKHNLDFKRAIFPGPDKHSIRVFPPTNLTASVTLPPVIHPIGDFPLEMRLSGIVAKKCDAQTRWRLRKLNWRIEETQKFVAPACSKHVGKVGGEGKGVLHEDVHTIAQEEVKHGWKTDYDQGNIDVEFRAAVNPSLKHVCDMDSESGMSVRHNLIIEMVVAEEWAPLKKLQQATPTGAARVLRTQFHLILTERTGMGIAWDEEQPPIYEDVPASPPTYVDDYNLENLDSEDGEVRL